MKSVLLKRKSLVFATIILGIISSLAYVYIARILQSVTDTAISGNMGMLVDIVIQAAVFFVSLGLVNLILGLLSRRLVTRIIQDLRSNLFEGILRRSSRDFSKVNTADYLSALSNDINLIEENGISPLLILFQQGIIFIAALIYAFIISPLVGAVLLGSMLLMLLLPAIFGSKLQRIQEKQSKRLSIFTTYLKDVFSGYEIIKSYRMGRRVKRDFQKENNAAIQIRISSDNMITYSESLAETLAYISLFSGFFVGAFLSISGHITTGTLIALIQLASSMVNPLMLAMQSLPRIQGAVPVVRRITDLANYTDITSEGKKIPSFNTGIVLRNVSFSYDDSRRVLQDINLDIEKNKKLAFVGPSGCGKTTLVRLIAGEHASYQGSVVFDGSELQSLQIDHLHDLMSVIHQNVYLFDTSIEENIMLDQSFSSERTSEALKLSGLLDFLGKERDGLKLPVGENGRLLSGGQRQRIAVARALIRKKPLLIIDEGTSSIDMQTAYDIEQRLFDIKDLTLLTITHAMNKEILSKYDKIFYMENGKILECGSFEGLIQKQGAFYRFFNWQRKENLIA